MTRRYRPRKEFKFWLYHDLLEDKRLMDYIDYLRKTRQFARTLRSGLRLMWTLGEGDLSVLFELFPALRSQFMPKADDLIEQFHQMLLQNQPVIPETPQMGAISAGDPKSLPAPQIAMPTFDEEDTIVIRHDMTAGTRATSNFLDAAFGFQERKDTGDV
jgi:hypothetical protein